MHTHHLPSITSGLLWILGLRRVLSVRSLAHCLLSSFLELRSILLVGIENSFAAKVGLEKELATAKDQVDVLTAERDSAFAAPLLNANIDSLSEELRLAKGGHWCAPRPC
ncbi:hypothetical protein PIB30_084582 [Stylosanthes scabra]|uniref:Uncharacterized protein n=1 Tax=Stylosanthes scabra TaxID=79078 RepID=A0ABU6TS47_9FABA|nr:hypothetical protein [Stylosanthes scabra]